MNIERKHLKYAAIPLALATGLGLTACVGKELPDAPASGPLEAVSIIGASKNGYINAVNIGEEAVVYDPSTSQDIGSIAVNESFEIICEIDKPNAYVVEFGQNQQGNVNLGHEFLMQPIADIPTCDTPNIHTV